MRENPKAEGARWLEQAKVDLRWARHLLDQGRTTWSASCGALALAEAVVAQVEGWFARTKLPEDQEDQP